MNKAIQEISCFLRDEEITDIEEIGDDNHKHLNFTLICPSKKMSVSIPLNDNGTIKEFPFNIDMSIQDNGNIYKSHIGFNGCGDFKYDDLGPKICQNDDPRIPIIEWAIGFNGFAIQALSEHLRTREMYEKAVKNDGDVLTFMPESYRTYSVCLDAVNSKKASDGILYSVPIQFITREMCRAAVSNNGLALKFITGHLAIKKVEGWDDPNDILNEEFVRSLCLIAVQYRLSSLVFQYIPSRFIDRNLCLLAIQHDGMSLQGTPKELRDMELCWAAVKSNGLALQWVPEWMRDKRICLEAAKKDINVMEFIPEEWHDSILSEVRALKKTE